MVLVIYVEQNMVGECVDRGAYSYLIERDTRSQEHLEGPGLLRSHPEV